MIGIRGIGSYLPDDAVDNLLQAQRFGESEDFINKKIGAVRLPRKSADQDTSDLAQLAVQNLFERFPELDAQRIDALILVTQNPDAEGLPHTSAILQQKLNLPTSIAAFDVSLGCSGYVYGLYILKGFLQASGGKNGLLVTSDPYSKILNMEDRVTSLLFGDAATATWLGEDADWSLGSVVYGTDGAGAEYLKVSDRQLSMNGRQIFNFAATQVAPQIDEVLRREGVSADEVDLYCLHQGSAAIVDAVSRRYKSLAGRFLKDMENTGNTVSSTIPLLLQDRLSNPDYRRILLSGFGVGLSIATAVINKSGED